VRAWHRKVDVCDKVTAAPKKHCLCTCLSWHHCLSGMFVADESQPAAAWYPECAANVYAQLRDVALIAEP
jgi:hypothetical protein